MDGVNDVGAAGAEGASGDQAAVCQVVAAVRALDRGDGREADRIVDQLVAELCVHHPDRAAGVGELIQKALFVGGMPIALGSADDVHAVMAEAWDLVGPVLAWVVGVGGLLFLGLREGWLPELERIQLDALVDAAGPRARAEAGELLRRIYRWELE